VVALNSSLPPVLCLMGPTAAGKTAFAEALADQLPVDLISVDSALIYRGMDIGTGKPDAAELARYPHALIDICDPAESYSAARFRDDALSLIASAHQRQRLPVLVGGTMLYYKTLIEGIAELPDADPAVRARLEQEREQLGLVALHQRLQQLDPEAGARIHPNDPQRLLRALEVISVTGEPMSALWRRSAGSGSGQPAPYRFVQVGLLPDRAWLHGRIAARFDAMLAAGLIEEVARLRDRGDLQPDLPSMRCVGYRQSWDWLDARDQGRPWPLAELRERGVAATRQLAKRQYTWLRGWPLDLSVSEYLGEQGAVALKQVLTLLKT
jgi:tRNA dimethylallyltransferase